MKPTYKTGGKTAVSLGRVKLEFYPILTYDTVAKQH